MTRSQTLELLTPCFCAGISKSHPEMRLPSIRGQLRWWHRILCGAGKPEYELFGGIKGKQFGYSDEAVASSFRLSLTAAPSNSRSEKKLLIPHKNHSSFAFDALSAGSKFTLEWTEQPHPNFVAKANDPLGSETRSQQLERVLKTWLLLGTVGRRATRAMGSIWPVDFAPTVSEFNQILASLRLPSTVKYAVLDATTPNPRESAEELVKIAGETIHGLKRHKVDRNTGRAVQGIDGDPLGYVDKSNRKASPLRFKVGKFSDGLRLIAIWDNREGRGGDLRSAIPELSPALHNLLNNEETREVFFGGPVEELLQAPYDFSSIDKYKIAFNQWQSEGRTDLVMKFIDLTQDAKYGGLRKQAWYPKPES